MLDLRSPEALSSRCCSSWKSWHSCSIACSVLLATVRSSSSIFLLLICNLACFLLAYFACSLELFVLHVDGCASNLTFFFLFFLTVGDACSSTWQDGGARILLLHGLIEFRTSSKLISLLLSAIFGFPLSNLVSLYVSLGSPGHPQKPAGF